MNATVKPICNESLVVRCTPDMRAALEQLAGDRRKLSATVREACAAYIASQQKRRANDNQGGAGVPRTA